MSNYFNRGFIRHLCNIDWRSVVVDANKVIDGWSIMFHFIFVSSLFYYHANMWHKAYLYIGDNVYNQFPLTYYNLTTDWIWFWTLIWYFTILYSLVWACRWTPGIPNRYESPWIKPPVPYWKWWNNTFLFFLPRQFINWDSRVKYKLFIIIICALCHWAWVDYLFWQHLGFYINHLVVPSSDDNVWVYTKQLYVVIFGFLLGSVDIFCDNIGFEYLIGLYWLYLEPLSIVFISSLGLIFKFTTTWGLLFGILLYFFMSASSIRLLLSIILFMLNLLVLLFCIQVEFFAILVLIVYIGAVSILFLFVVILLNVRGDARYSSKIRYIWGCFILFWFVNNFHTNFSITISPSLITTLVYDNTTNWSIDKFKLDDMFNVAGWLYTWSFLYLVLIAVLLFGVMVGTIALLLTI